MNMILQKHQSDLISPFLNPSALETEQIKSDESTSGLVSMEPDFHNFGPFFSPSLLYYIP